MRPKVTVLMAVRDGEPFVHDAVESVLSQTFADFELLVVDDASTDGTVATVEAFGDPRVRLLRNERNLGQVPSLNRGLREAVGSYIARLDADDVCLPARLARQVEVLDSQPDVALVGTWMRAIDTRGRTLGHLRKTLDDYVDFVYHTLIMRVYVSHPSAMYRRDPVLALGGYDDATGPAEDKDLWRKLALQRYEARIVPEELVLYRLHGRQLSHVRAAYQQEIDAKSQDRFLAALAPRANVAAARTLLAGDAEAFDAQPADALRGVESILEGARERLGLDADESRRLDERVANRLFDVALARPRHASARAVAAYALSRLPQKAQRAARRRRVLALVARPPVTVLRRLTRVAAAQTETMPGFRGIRRSPLARRLYGKAVGSR